MISLVVFIFICFSAAALGSVSTSSSLKSWYPTLKKPSWNPPNYLFAPVWTVLYLLMAVSAWMVWQRVSHQGISVPITLFLIQLLLNAAWSVIFFGLQSPRWAFVEVLCLWVAIACTMISFWSVSTLAAVLMLPYLAWVSFAAYLNGVIWRLNR